MTVIAISNISFGIDVSLVVAVNVTLPLAIRVAVTLVAIIRITVDLNVPTYLSIYVGYKISFHCSYPFFTTVIIAVCINAAEDIAIIVVITLLTV